MGRKAPDGKRNNRSSGAFRLCPELGIALLVQQALSRFEVQDSGAAMATEMGTVAGVSYVTSPGLGQLARVALTTSTHSTGCNRAPAQSHQTLQQNLRGLPV